MLAVENNIQPSIMASLETLKEEALKPDVVGESDFKSIPFTATSDCYQVDDTSSVRSILLMDANENLSMATPELFMKALRCSDNQKIKVVSIFGNTGDGKSHTMNHVFFDGDNIFKTSNEQDSCTIGVYAAIQREMGVLCLDTEGLLSTSSKNDRRMRMLLKILAISDIVIYRTRSERLHSDMFEFLGTASMAFSTHFAQALQSLALPGTAKTLGPAVIVFHETRHTKPLEGTVQSSAEDQIREGFQRFDYETNAFSSLRYIGMKTESGHKTNFRKLIQALQIEIENTSVRSARQPSIVFKAMKALNMKFSGNIERTINPFPEQYFTCPTKCLSCHKRCQRSMGHEQDRQNHLSHFGCEYQHQYENKVYLCKMCYNNGKEVIVEKRALTQNESSLSSWAMFAWKGYVIECSHCGEIYRSRQHWYGNEAPEVLAVRPQIVHVWQGGNILKKGPVHSAQMVLDGVTYITDTLTGISAQPTKALSGWLANKVRPGYWVPDEKITHCKGCQKNFVKTDLPKHHCRGCGEGFCNACSLHRMPVPARGWDSPVRVCNDCRKQLQTKADVLPGPSDQSTDEADILARKYGESLFNAISSVKAVAWEYPKEIIKNTARPDYWVEDKDAPNCHICRTIFGTAEELELVKENGNGGPSSNASATLTSPTRVAPSNGGRATTTTTAPSKSNGAVKGDCWRHHCRRCGQAVCEACSTTRCPVPERGWPTNVRVCDACLHAAKSTADGVSKAA